ncbi:MAG: ABC transporter permease subunit [archaeon]|nr:ABC transporter permease subunit [archaeon]MDA1129866.1 ABC transporter permease subunit [archaeon]
MSGKVSNLKVISLIVKEKIFSTRMLLMFPILLLFIPGMAWGFSDPNIILPGGHRPETPMEVLFYSSLGIVFGGTMCAVLMAFDGVSKERASGVLEVKLAQPMSRLNQTLALVHGTSIAVIIPVTILVLISAFIIRYRMGVWPEIMDLIVHIIATGLILIWYTLFTLIASSKAREQGTAMAFGVGIWFFFTFLWALVTSMVAYASGIAIGQDNDSSWIALEGALDLFSPNGVYHHILETRLSGVQRGVSGWQITIMAIAWTVLPLWILARRMENLVP